MKLEVALLNLEAIESIATEIWFYILYIGVMKDFFCGYVVLCSV